MTATVTRKGQVTIPKPLRDRLGIRPGSSVDFEMTADGRVALFKVEKDQLRTVFERLRGRLSDGPSTDDVMRLTRGEG